MGLLIKGMLKVLTDILPHDGGLLASFWELSCCLVLDAFVLSLKRLECELGMNKGVDSVD